MRIALLTTLYPNAAAPAHGVFVENRLRAYLKKYDADVKIIAPVPWFPFSAEMFGQYGRFARAPLRETRHGLEVFHPRYLIAPKIGMEYAPQALASAFRKKLQELSGDGWTPDLIDAHYFYPDGVAAAAVATELDLPIAITARGTDINLIPEYDRPREKILGAAVTADAIITVAEALRDRLIDLGAPQEKITTLRNGVDLDTFKPGDRNDVRARLGVSGPVIASIGHLIERKGHHLVIDALLKLPEATLLVAGDGEQRRSLEKRAEQIGVSERVRFLGAVPHEKLRDIYNAADVLALASSREGWPNVLLEAMACGTPCVATNVWGNAEVISTPAAGRLVIERNADSIADALTTLLANPPSRHETRAHAEAHSWDATADGMAAIFTELAEKGQRAQSVKVSSLSFKKADAPKLIVTVDTEEIFDWATFHPDAYELARPKDIDAFQSLCESMNIAPLYFLSYPLIAEADTARYFKSKTESGAAHCGLHMHPWVTPPHSDFKGEYYSYQKNYPAAEHRKKLKALADIYENVFGTRASAHRAGRYGIARDNYPFLAEIDVTHDFSPSPAFSFSKTGGPDFSALSNHPFSAQTPPGPIAVIPVTAARAIRHTNVFLSQENSAPGFAAPRERFGFSEPVRLSPESAELNTLKALTGQLLTDKTPILTFTLHSTSLTVGANEYAQTQGDIDNTLSVARDYLDWFRQSVGGDIVSYDALKAAMHLTQP